MVKNILITGSTDGIGKDTALLLLKKGHNVTIHGRNKKKVEAVQKELLPFGNVKTYCIDLSIVRDVIEFTGEVVSRSEYFDVIINNAGVLKSTDSITIENLDVRFSVNSIAPYVIATRLFPLLKKTGRIVNVSSAAQSLLDLDVLRGEKIVDDDMSAYAQSKTALMMWSTALVHSSDWNGIDIININPGSLLGTNMVKEGFGIAGKDISKGSSILLRAVESEMFHRRSGSYYDNDIEAFTTPISSATDVVLCREVVNVIETIIKNVCA